jgi:hypothetical protein
MPLKTRRNWIQEEVGVAVSSAVGVKATKRTAHKRIAREFSAVVRRRTVFVETTIHQWQIRQDPQLPT